MSAIPWLTIAIVLPLIGSVVVAAMPSSGAERAKQVTLAFSVLVLAVVAAMALQFSPGGPRFQFEEVYPWIPAFGISYAVGVDGIALLLILLSALLVPLVVLAGWNEVDASTSKYSTKTYFALILVLEAMMIAVFAATDVFLFYVVFEAMLIPVYFMIGGFGTGRRRYAAIKFLLYSLFGGLLMLVAVIGLYVAAGQQGEATFLWEPLAAMAADIDPATARWLFLGFFIAFAIKAPLWPVHTWLPSAAESARPGTAVLLVGVLDKVGTFGMLRFCLELFPEASRWAAWPIVILALISILYGAVVAIGQTDMMRLVAYTSVSHFGFIVLGVFAFTTQGHAGAALYMVNHGLSTGALFLIVGFLMLRRTERSQLIGDYTGVGRTAPLLAGTFLVAGLASLSLPGLSPFVSEFLVFMGTFTRYPVIAIIAALGVILAALYILWLYQRTMTGPRPEGAAPFADLSPRELLAVGPLVALLVLLGLFPQPMLDVVNPAVESTLEQVGATDPAPEVPAAAEEGTSE
ncbi:NADH-quinone oxidoreductase subunit M [Allonocardiopsis opalescens]|uniref:NADH dehydrogenase subunit M n=1 Tax=Allonocardiopsis opalescens TaxID=1144618 RepID=A0A2T0Q7W9_9ACTN|nr:NADH-quinone oxidoreductase subunit M [Allonocardiopsis opalescens]PRX99925.1 NADH dehydrogenase subunit M [Allonocardiopsis opalescens]